MTPAQRRAGPHSYSKEESLKGIQPTSIVLPAFLECVTTAVVKKKETKQMRMLWPLAEYRSRKVKKKKQFGLSL